MAKPVRDVPGSRPFPLTGPRLGRLALALLAALGGTSFRCRRDASPRARAPQAADLRRVVSAGGAVTEVVFALGEGGRVVGVDSSSTWPEAATRLPQVGYLRALSAEGILALRPTLLLTTTDAGPPSALQQLRGAGVPVLDLPAAHGVDAARARIRAVAAALGREAQGRALLDALDRDLAAVPAPPSPRRRVVFLYARGAGTLNVAGRDTAADAMLRLVGADNAVTGYEGYRPLTAESLVAAAPDVILLTARGLASMGGADAILALAGVGATPAGRARAVVAMDDLALLGFGPRLGASARELATLLRAAPR